LLTLIEAQRCEDLAQSIVEMYQQLGYMDRWPFANFPTGVMTGYPMTIIMSEIWNAGLHNFDINTAYTAMYQDATNGDAQIINTIGWLTDPSTMMEDSESYAALATVADSLGKTSDAATFRKQADKLNNIYNPATQFLEPRYSDGSWRADFNPELIEANYTDGYIEGSAWHYLWLVPQDEAMLIRLQGGPLRLTSDWMSFSVIRCCSTTLKARITTPITSRIYKLPSSMTTVVSLGRPRL
jgi:putative alpha-1,2-mannosidase